MCEAKLMLIIFIWALCIDLCYNYNRFSNWMGRTAVLDGRTGDGEWAHGRVFPTDCSLIVISPTHTRTTTHLQRETSGQKIIKKWNTTISVVLTIYYDTLQTGEKHCICDSAAKKRQADEKHLFLSLNHCHGRTVERRGDLINFLFCFPSPAGSTSRATKDLRDQH